MEFLKKLKRRLTFDKVVADKTKPSEQILPQVKFLTRKRECKPNEDSFKIHFEGVIKFASFINHGRYLLFAYLDENTKQHKVKICACKVAQLKFAFDTIFELDLDLKYITHVMLVNQNAFIVLGFTSKQKLLLFHYSIVIHNSIPQVQYSSCSVLPGYRFTPLTTIVTASKTEGCLFALVLMDSSRHPQPLLLYVYELKCAMQLKNFLDLRSFVPKLRGIVSDLCFVENSIILATTCFQLCILDSTKSHQCFDKLISLTEKPVLLEDNEELIFLLKLESYSENYCNDCIYALSQSCCLYILNKDELLSGSPLDFPGVNGLKCIDLDGSFLDPSRVSWCTLCNYSQSLAILHESGTVNFYDLQRFQFRFAIDLSATDFRYSILNDWFIFMNWYGDEIYYIRQNCVDIYVISTYDNSLRHNCKLKILSSFSEKQITDSQIPKSLIDYILYG